MLSLVCLCDPTDGSTNTHIHTYTHKSHTFTHIHKDTYTYTQIHTHTYLQTYVHTYIHTYVHTYIHTYTHTILYEENMQLSMDNTNIFKNALHIIVTAELPSGKNIQTKTLSYKKIFENPPLKILFSIMRVIFFHVKWHNLYEELVGD